jgi:hypothetical protein
MLISGMTARKRHLVSVLAGLAMLAVARPFAQQVQQAKEVRRTVESPRAGPLAVDFLAVSKDDARTPILDLTREAVTLRVAGRNRVITRLELVRMDASSPAPLPALAAPAFPAPFATNVDPVFSGRGRRVEFVIDTESIRAGEEGALRTAVNAFLARLGPSDRVGVLEVPHGGMNVAVTAELPRVREAIDHFTGAAPATETVMQATDRSRLNVEALTSMLGAMNGSERPTTVIYIGSSLMGPSATAPLKRTRNGDFQATTQDPVGRGDLSLETFQFVGAAVSAARAQIFVVQIEGSMTIPDASSGAASQGLASLASLGGGEFFSHLALGEEDAIARVARATSAYYVATFDADSSDKFSMRYPIVLSSSRADVTFLVRPDYQFVKSPTNTKAPAPGDILKIPGAFRDLPMRAVAYSVRPLGADRDRVTWVKALAEIVTPGGAATAASAALYSLTNQLVWKYDLTAADLVNPVLQAALQAPPGRYRLRFAATDGKASGAVDCPIDVGLTPAGDFTTSSLMIGPKLLFSTEPEALAVFELYGRNTGQHLLLEVSLIGAAAEPKLLESKVVAAAREPDKYIVSTVVPLADLPPGDYQVRATVGVVGQPAGTLTATLRKIK